MAAGPSNDEGVDRKRLDFFIRLAAIATVLYLCFRLAIPFVEPIAWGLVLAAGLHPLYEKLVVRLKGRRKTASALVAITLLVIIAVPVLLLGESLLEGVQHLAKGLREGTLTIPPPSEKVKSWPLVGEKVAGLWQLASDNLAAFLEAEAVYVKDLGTKALGLVTGAALALGQFILSVIIAVVMLAKAEAGERFAHGLARRLAGDGGDALVSLAAQTVRSVAVGVLGVAVLQAILAGGGLLVAGVPAAGLLSMVVLVLCVVQLGPGLVMFPVAIWLFSTGDTVRASLFLVWAIVLMPLDNILKPILLGRGVRSPMLIVFMGSLGGFLRSGIIGLFTGAVVLVLGYELFMAWLRQRAAENGGEGAPSAGDAPAPAASLAAPAS
ncbi:MAG: AI-2E family transporter [Myxococcota bacterium]